MKTFTLEQIAQVTGGMLTKNKDVAITNIAPPLLADENTLALALGEDEIANLANTKARKFGQMAHHGRLVSPARLQHAAGRKLHPSDPGRSPLFYGQVRRKSDNRHQL